MQVFAYIDLKIFEIPVKFLELLELQSKLWELPVPFTVVGSSFECLQ